MRTDSLSSLPHVHGIDRAKHNSAYNDENYQPNQHE